MGARVERRKVGCLADAVVAVKSIVDGVGKKANRKYMDDFITADIECTNIHALEIALPYHWQIYAGGVYYFGRFWRDFAHILNNIRCKKTLVCYIHNLGYEFQFLKSWLPFQPEKVFAMDSRTVLRASVGGIEFRCSYMLTNQSLHELTKTWDVKHKKLKDDLDYRVYRTPFTALTPREESYCVNDVVGLYEAIQAIMKARKVTTKTIPLTKTGFVRSAVKEFLKYTMTACEQIQSDYEVFTYLRAAFAGGRVHANPSWVGQIMPDVHSADISSSYPAQILTRKYPVTAFKRVDNGRIRELYKKKALLINARIYDLKIKRGFLHCPCISRHKIRGASKCIDDNGRVVACDVFTCTITDIDLKLWAHIYDFEIEVLDLWAADYGLLPQQLRGYVADLYRKKTKLKGIPERKTEYNLAKEDANSVYGMMVFDIGRPRWIYKDMEIVLDESVPEEEHYKKSIKRNPLIYAWGVWVTAWSRWALQEGIDVVGEYLGYTDTDSVYYQGEHDFTSLNEVLKKRAIKCGGYETDSKGVTHYVGCWEFDPPTDNFCTWGAKKYCTQTGDDLKLTTAGVNKEKGAAELIKGGGIDAYQPGFTWLEAGGTRSVYKDFIIPPDSPGFKALSKYLDDFQLGHDCTGVYITDTTYTLSLAPSFLKFLDSKDFYYSFAYKLKTTMKEYDL